MRYFKCNNDYGRAIRKPEAKISLIGLDTFIVEKSPRGMVAFLLWGLPAFIIMNTIALIGQGIMLVIAAFIYVFYGVFTVVYNLGFFGTIFACFVLALFLAYFGII